ncbi:ISAon1 family transposase [Algoriphagus jejuensis]|uniref:ISAon1 family transposase n=1 Tax=Algoriphagus jejuensis TaxID=419934 RepID=UPI0031DDEA96
MPKGLLEFFKGTSARLKDNACHIYLEELNIYPEHLQGARLTSKGFYDEVAIQDFPLRGKVREVTLDMAASMERIVRRSFPKAQLVTDRFHVQQLVHEAVQEMRIAHRWEAIDQENREIELSRECGRAFVPDRLENGDTKKQLLARSRYLLFKGEDSWTPSQAYRAELLFHRYPDLEKAYRLSRSLARIYQTSKMKGVAFTKLAHWYNDVELAGFKSFNTVSRTIQNHYKTILNFFENISTNASAESFNAKIKAFRAQFGGVTNVEFFLFRLSNIYA